MAGNYEYTSMLAKDGSKKPANRTSAGHHVVGSTTDSEGKKGANILQHKNGKYFAAGGASWGFRKNMTLHDTPEAAADAYHSKKPARTLKEWKQDI